MSPPTDSASSAASTVPVSASGGRSSGASASSLRDVVESEQRKESRRRLVRWLLLLLLIVAGAVLAYWLRPKPIAESAKYKTAAVSVGDVVHQVSATGRLESRRTVQVGAEISGRIARVEVDWDQPVKAGQVLFRFEPESLRAQVAQVRAQLAAAQAALAQARIDAAEAQRQAARSKQLFEAGADSAMRRDTADAQVEASKARILAASAQVALQQASYELARTNLEHAVVRSPIDGVVISRSIEPGQTVAAALQSPVLLVLAEDLREMRVLVAIDEADVGETKPGQEATFTVDAYPTETFRATVREIRSAPTMAQGVVTYEAVLDVDNSALKLKPGMTASVKVKTASVRGALRVPNAALRFSPPNRVGKDGTTKDGVAQVWTLAATGPVALRVQPGVSDGSFTAVQAEGLRDGSEVLVDLTAEGRKAYGLDDKSK
jgi:HlyD family secretion protein